MKTKLNILITTLLKKNLFNKKRISEKDRKEVANLCKLKQFYYESLQKKDDAIFVITKINHTRKLLILFKKSTPPHWLTKFNGKKIINKNISMLICSYNHNNAVALRELFPYTRPQIVDKPFTFGCGYRPPYLIGNIIQAKVAKKLKLNCMLAQQSARELSRTGRTFQEVVDAATFSAFEANLNIPYGADADHLKTEKDVEQAVNAGCTYFTYDPSEELREGQGVRGKGQGARGKGQEVRDKRLKELFVNTIKDAAERERIIKTYLGTPFNIPNINYEFQKSDIMCIASKYYAALKLVEKLYKLTKKLKGKEQFQVEVSLDETKNETTLLELIFVSNELRKLDIKVTAIAPRFIGFFEKAIDYYLKIDEENKKIIDIKLFEERLKQINAIAKYFNYKIAIHSGSDKFTIYPILGRIAKDRLHIKTAGTYYLEELKLVAKYNPGLFKKIFYFAVKRFQHDKATYQLTTNLNNIPNLDNLTGKEIATLLDAKSGNGNMRQLLHVTYGSVLKKFGNKISVILKENEKELFALFKKHITNHIKPICNHQRGYSEQPLFRHSDRSVAK